MKKRVVLILLVLGSLLVLGLKTKSENLKFEKFIIEVLFQSAIFDDSKISSRHNLSFEKIIMNQKSVTLIEMQRKGHCINNYTSL